MGHLLAGKMISSVLGLIEIIEIILNTIICYVIEKIIYKSEMNKM